MKGGFFNEVRIVFRLMAESIVFAFSAIRTDRFRTVLSLFGVAIGIFSVVTVFCAVDALRRNISEGLKTFGSDVVIIQQFPFTVEEGEEYRWWEYLQRPPVTEDEYSYIRSNSETAQTIVFSDYFYGYLSRGRNSFSDAVVIMSTEGLEKIINIGIAEGRLFTSGESRGASGLAVIGHNVAQELFPADDPVGKRIKVNGANVTVIGVADPQGESMVSMMDMDNAVIVPVRFGKNLGVFSSNAQIWAVARDDVSQDGMIAELRLLMRSFRRLTPVEKDDFAIDRMSFLMDVMDSVMGTINIAGLIIGGFSLLIGGFGIANIMFVSVKERTPQIGIQKALGAKRYVILTQFLAESAVLSLAGGVVGLVLVSVATLFLRDIEGFDFTLSMGNVMKGLAVAVAVGILSGLIPSYSAARMNPVKAINS